MPPLPGLLIAAAAAATASALTAGNVILFRVGEEGSTTAFVSNTAASLYLDEYSPATLSRVSVTSAGSTCTVTGASVDCAPSLAGDGMSVVWPCWGVAAGAAVGSGVVQGLGRIAADGVVTYPKGLAITTLSSGLRAAATKGGASDGFYFGTSSGMKYMASGSSTTVVSITGSTNASVRTAVVANGGLYASHQTTGMGAVALVGSPPPTAAGTSTLIALNLPGLASVLTALQGFVFQSSTVMWACDSTQGLARVELVGGSWGVSSGYPRKFTRPDTLGLVGCRGVVGVPNATSAAGELTLWVSTGNGGGLQSWLAVFNTESLVWTAVAQATAGTDFRYVTAAPTGATPSATASPPATPTSSTTAAETATSTAAPTPSVSQSSGASPPPTPSTSAPPSATASLTASPSLSAAGTPPSTSSSTPTASRSPTSSPAAGWASRSNVLVLRVGALDASVAPSNVGTPVYVDEYDAATLAVLPERTVALPAASCLLSGTTTTEGFTATTGDAAAFMFACWSGGTAGASTSGLANTIARVAYNGLVSYPRGSFTSLSSGLRSAVSINGTTHYVGTSSGLRFSVGSAGAFFAVTTSTNSSTRALLLRGGALYASHQSSTPGIAMLAPPPTLLTTTTTLVSVNMPGTGAAVPAVNGFAFQDDATIWACDGTLGLAKLALVGGVWGMAPGFPRPFTRPDTNTSAGCRGLAAVTTPEGDFTVWVTTATAAGNWLARYTPSTDVWTAVAQSGTGYDFRMVSAVPSDPFVTPTTTATPSSTPSPSGTPSGTASSSGTRSPPPTASVTQSAGASPEPTPSATAPVTASPSATPPGTSSVTASPPGTPSGSTTSSPTPSRTPTTSPPPTNSPAIGFASTANVLVLRVGALDSVTPTNASTWPVFLDEYSVSGRLPARTLAFPAYAPAPNGAQLCTLSGTTSTEGYVATSGDGSAVTFACWSTVAGSVTSGSTLSTVARVSFTGVVTYPRGSFAGLSSGLRAAYQANASMHYVGTSSGLRLSAGTAAFYAVTSSSNSSTRQLVGRGGSLYVSHQQAGSPGIAELAPAPIAASSTTMYNARNMPGTGAAVPAVNGFVFQDDATIWACDGTLGLAKLALVGGVWGMAGGFPRLFTRPDNNATAACRGLAGVVDPATSAYMLWVTTASGAGNWLAVFNSATADWTPVAQSGAGYDFRMVVAVPSDPAIVPTPAPSASTPPSSSATRSSTRTPAGTPSVTPSPSVSPSLSPTPSASSSGSQGASPTTTPSASRTGTPPPTPSPPSTSSATPSVSPSAAATQSITPSAAATQSSSPSAAATQTATPSSAATQTASPSSAATETSSPSSTETQTASPSSAATQTGSPSGSGTAAATVSSTGTQSGTGSGSDSATAAATASGTAAATASGTAAASLTGTAASTGTASRSATGTRSKTAVATRSRTGSRTRTASATRTKTKTKTKTRTRTPSKKKLKMMA